jgi:hypothetical protein
LFFSLVPSILRRATRWRTLSKCASLASDSASLAKNETLFSILNCEIPEKIKPGTVYFDSRVSTLIPPVLSGPKNSNSDET